METRSHNFDTTLVTLFFAYFGLITFYYVGVQMKFIENLVEKVKELLRNVHVPKTKISSVPPKLISAKYNKLSEFLTGRSKYKVFENSVSLFLSNVNPVNLIGVPTSVYLQGIQYFSSEFSFPIAVFFTNKMFVPVFYKLQVKTSNQYIDKRFNFKVKSLCVALMIVINLIKMGIWLNTPNLILTNFTVISSQFSLALTVLIVVIYTSLGGMAVIKKMEKIQLSIMLIALLSVVSKGIGEVGGLVKVYEENKQHNRLSPNLDLNVFTNQQSVLLVLLSNTFSWCSTYSLQQASLNRYLTTGSVSVAKKIIYWQAPLMALFYFVICFIGLLVYTFYFRCDPFMTNRINHLEALIGLFSHDMTRENRSGILGLFIIALYSITLSSISSSLNGLSTIVFEDILVFYDLEINSNIFMRIATCLFGFVIVITMISLQFFKQSLKLRSMLTNALSGPVFGIFLLGLHTRRVTSTFALIGMVVGLFFGFYSFAVHFKDGDKFTSIGLGFEDCVDYFCQMRPQLCEIDSVTHNVTVIAREDQLKQPILRHAFTADIDQFSKLSYNCDGWTITFFTIFVTLFMSLFFREPDKSAYEIEECLATYMQKAAVTDSVQNSVIASDPAGANGRHETETTYVLEENENKNKDEIKDLESKEEMKEEVKDSEKSGEESDNVIDINYLRKAIDELFVNSNEM